LNADAEICGSVPDSEGELLARKTNVEGTTSPRAVMTDVVLRTHAPL
jgi:hypothetical protein